MLEQCGLGRWKLFQQFASSGEELISGRVDISCTAPLAVHDYDKAFEALHMHRLKTEEVRVMRESH